MIKITNRGQGVLSIIESLSESDIRLLGTIANEHSSLEKSVEGMEYIGYARTQIQRLQMMGYIKGE